MSILILLTATGCSEDSGAGIDSAEGRTIPTLNVELTRRWWEWAASEPTESNPVADTTGEDCLRGQPTDVFFLAGSFGTTEARRCEVPSGTPLLIPVLNQVCGPDITDCGFPSTASKNATLDGQALEIINVASESPVTVEMGAGNAVFPDISGPVSVQLNGDWVLLPPLAPGLHDLRVWGGLGSFNLDVTYHLVVP